MRFGTLVLAVAMGIATPATADTIVINNGLGPPNPENVIDSVLADSVYVQNAGCDATVLHPCPMPWGSPTSIELVDGASVSQLRAYESSTIAMEGGWVDSGLAAYDSATVTVTGGFVRIDFSAYDSSTVILSGGSVLADSLRAYGTSTITITGGSVDQYLVSYDSSTITMSGGGVGDSVFAHDSSSVTIRGGHLPSGLGDGWRGPWDVLVAFDSSTIDVVGSDFAVDGMPVDYGVLAAKSGFLTGRLESGEPIGTRFCHNDCRLLVTGLITLVPKADVIVINNGQVPPNPANVIDADNSFPDSHVYVQNVGCDASGGNLCPVPWGDATSVRLVDGGVVFGVAAYESSAFTMTGGSARAYLDARESSTVSMSGGSVPRLLADDSSFVTFSGGSVGDFLAAYDASRVTMSGGEASSLLAYDSSNVAIIGGEVGSVFASGSSSVTISGGSVHGVLAPDDSSRINIVGSDFAVNGGPVDYGVIAADFGTLSGTLKSGGVIDVGFFCHKACSPPFGSVTGLITLVPEPDPGLLGMTGLLSVLGLSASRRRRAN